MYLCLILCISFSCYVSLSLTVYHCLLLCISVSCCVSLSLAVYHCLVLCISVSLSAYLCLLLCISVSYCVSVSCCVSLSLTVYLCTVCSCHWSLPSADQGLPFVSLMHFIMYVLCHLGLLYAVGGYDGASRHCLSSVECYSPVNDTWTPVLDMSCRRSGAGAHSFILG